MLVAAAIKRTAEQAVRSRRWVSMLLIEDLIEALAADALDVTPHAANAIRDEGLQLTDILKAICRTTPYTRNLSRDRRRAWLIVLPSINQTVYEVILAREVDTEEMAMVTVTEHHDAHYRRHGRGVLDVDGDWVFEFEPSASALVA